MLHTQDEEGNYTNTYKRPKNKKSKLLREYKITNKLISELFEYSNQQSFNSSSAKLRILKGVEGLILHIKAL